jgi:hypothetical protein
MLPAEGDNSLYSSSLVALQAEIRRVRRWPLSQQRVQLMSRLVLAVREIQTALENPQPLSWQYDLSRLSRLDIASGLACAFIATIVSVEAFRQRHDMPAAGLILLPLTLLGALYGAVFCFRPLKEGMERRRRLRAALQLAASAQAEMPRPIHAQNSMFSRLPADLLVLACIAIGVLAREAGLRVVGGVVALAPMVLFVVEIARRRNLRLALPFTNRKARPLVILLAIGSFGLTILADKAGFRELPRLFLLGFALTFYYMGAVGLADKAVMSRWRIIGRNESPVEYWMFLVIYLVLAFAMIGMGFLA